jgi:signal transduction histidine kinase/ligand-binding sensor protein
MTGEIKRDLDLVLQGIADALRVPLVAHDAAGNQVCAWRAAEGSEASDGSEIWPLSPAQFGDKLCLLLTQGGSRRFVVRFSAEPEAELYIQSGDLPGAFPWIDEKLLPQVLPGLPFDTELGASFLLGLYVSTICRVVTAERPRRQAPRVDDLDVENVRRIGISLEKKIAGHVNRSRADSYSLGAVPSLEEFLPVQASSEADGPDLSGIFGLITTGTEASFNLMALSGDFVIQSKRFQPFCEKIVRPLRGGCCVASDLTCLIEAALLGKAAQGLAPAFEDKCHAGLTEVYAPVFAFGLIVGLVFGGQLVEDHADRLRIVQGFLAADQPEGEAPRLIRLAEPGTIKRAKAVVCGLSAMIGLLVERYSLARSEATLLGGVLAPVANPVRVILEEACHSIKRGLALADCSAFLVEQHQLVLAATTARKLYVRVTLTATPEAIAADSALGHPFYDLGEGLTGAAAASRKPRFEPNAKNARGWAGKCSETINSAQCFLAPIVCADECYGVLRAIRLAEFPTMPEEHRDLIATFAQHLGVALRYRELAEGKSIVFRKQANEMQRLLAEAAHEFRAPLHNILSLSTALRYTRASDLPALVGLQQQIKEEVYRAKRQVDNYLLRGIEGREDLEYNSQPGDLGDLVEDCASRFETAASRRGLRIRVDPSVCRLPRAVFDRERMEQVFSNLIDNAIKYSFANEYEGILIKAKDKPGTVTVSVLDWGLGIPPEAQKTIFEGYQRAVEDERVFKLGVGLGLKIAKEIVTRHGGTINAESEPFFGDPKRLARHEGFKTTFTVSLPKPTEKT